MDTRRLRFTGIGPVTLFVICLISGASGGAGAVAVEQLFIGAGKQTVLADSAAAASTDLAQLDTSKAKDEPAPEVNASAAMPEVQASADEAPIVPVELIRIRRLRRSGRVDAALEAVGALIDRQALSAPVHLESARIELELDHRAEAVGLAARAIELDPALAEAYLVLATVAEAEGRTEDASLAYAAYLERDAKGQYAAVARRFLRRHRSPGA